MPDLDLRIKVEPLSSDRFSIDIIDSATGKVRHRITGNDPNGLTEDDLRSAGGLPKCGLTETQIDETITSTNKKRI